MAGKGYGADATLVAAGFRLGQSNVPGDYSKIFEKQYEGLIAANKAKAQASIDFSKNLDENIKDLMKFKKEEEVDTSWFDEFETATTDYADGKIKENAKHYEENRPMSESHFNAAEDAMTTMKEGYETLNNKIILTKEEKRTKNGLKKQLGEFRDKLIKSKAEISTAVVGWDKGFYNTKQSFRGEPELNMLFSQVIEKDISAEKLKKKGIRIFWEDGKKMYGYTPGRAGAEVRSTTESTDTSYDAYSDWVTQQNEADPSTTSVPKYEEWVKSQPTKYNFILESSKKETIVSEKELLARLQPKDTKTEGDLNAIGTELLKNINKTTTNPNNGAKVRTIKDFESKRGKIQGDFKKVALLSENPNDIYTREINVGDTPMVYANDLQSNRNIDEAVINQMGIGSDVFTAKELEDGVIDPTELAKHKGAKVKIIEILTNPKTASQKEIAAEEYAKYRTDMLGNVFDAERKRIDEAVKTETSEEKARRLQAYELNSIAIQTKFKEAEKQGFTYENLRGLPIDKKMHFVKQGGKVYLAYKTSQGKDIKLVYNDPIDLKNKKQVLNILYSNSKIRPNEQNIKVTGGNQSTPYSNEYLNQFIINKE